MEENSNPLSIEKAVELFVKNLTNQGRSSNTIIAYKGDLAQLATFLFGEQISSVTEVETAHIEKFKKQLEKDNYTAKTISRKLNSFKSFFKFLEKEGVVNSDPTKEVSHPKLKIGAPKILQPLEYRALRDACRHDSRAMAIVELILQAGLRIGEVAGLRLDDVHPDEVIIQPYESHMARKVPLNEAVKNALDVYLESRGEAKTDHIFITKTGRPLLIRNIRSTLRRYFKRSGLEEIKVNDLRNTFIAYQLESGVPLEVISRIVGHKRISTTEKYLQLVKKPVSKRTIKLKEL
jgi:integrase/recombinase XerC